MTAEYILTQPKSWVPLTPAMKMVFAIGLNEIDRLQVIDDIEAKLRELNEAPEQEPVAHEQDAVKAAWDVLKPKLDPKDWTVSESFNYYGFFRWGWEAARQFFSNTKISTSINQQS